MRALRLIYSELTPCSRHRSGTAVPTLACLRAARIWLSLNLDRFMQNFLQVRKFYFSDPQLAGGITLWVKVNELLLVKVSKRN